MECSRRRSIDFLATMLAVSGAYISSVHFMQNGERANLHPVVIPDQALISLEEVQSFEQQVEFPALPAQY
uniref:Uncharacterized protein n=1 Tax=Physcomitrium patens TaxID=3218 RepID=A0A2K1JHS9_PHYPA|nr:hypothetical protein PHYPA_018514 [Physcomitrium patens]